MQALPRRFVLQQRCHALHVQGGLLHVRLRRHASVPRLLCSPSVSSCSWEAHGRSPYRCRAGHGTTLVVPPAVCEACPAHASSDKGSTSLSACHCNRGYFDDDDDDDDDDDHMVVRSTPPATLEGNCSLDICHSQC